MPEAELDLSVFIPYLEKEESKAALKAYINIMYGTPEDVLRAYNTGATGVVRPETDTEKLDKASAPFQSFWMLVLMLVTAAFIGSHFGNGRNGAALGWIIGAMATYLGILFTTRLVGPPFLNRRHLAAKILLTLIVLAAMIFFWFCAAWVVIILLMGMSLLIGSIKQRIFGK